MFAIWADPGLRDRTQTQNNDMLWILVWRCFGGPLGAPRVSRGPLLGPLARNPALGLTTDGVGFANHRFGV
jgi:hypothetical protein